MKIVVASSVLNGREAFETLGDVTVLAEEKITRADLMDAEVLICRSKARLNKKLLEGTGVRFAGCAVAGTDHVDADYLAEAGIAWSAAPGCNANSVAEYVMTALFIEARRHGWALDEMTLGVIGVGHIGTRVIEKAMDIGMTVLGNDPPRAASESSARERFVELDELLAASDVVTLHVPLTQGGPWLTRGMVDYRFFEQLGSARLFINAARGEIMDSNAVWDALSHGVIRQAVLDVWEDEPRIRKDLLDAVDIGTPHIAGYSYEGRLNGTRMVYEEVCHFLEVEPVWTGLEEDGTGGGPETVIDAKGLTDQELLTRMAIAAYPLPEDDARFRAGASGDPEVMGRHFVQCRRNYPERREFAAARFSVQDASERALDAAWKLGFQIAD